MSFAFSNEYMLLKMRGVGVWVTFSISLTLIFREDLTDEEAYDLARRSIYHATFRDAASGGIVRG